MTQQNNATRPDDPWRYVEPRTDEQLAKLRLEVVEERGGDVAFTCDDCGARHVCTLAFDLYNTNGDCLDDK